LEGKPVIRIGDAPEPARFQEQRDKKFLRIVHHSIRADHKSTVPSVSTINPLRQLGKLPRELFAYHVRMERAQRGADASAHRLRSEVGVRSRAFPAGAIQFVGLLTLLADHHPTPNTAALVKRTAQRPSRPRSNGFEVALIHAFLRTPIGAAFFD
jgi:hypothetical protein